MRALWFTGGTLALALGMLGAVLPLLPSVPFLLLATFCYARSSPRLHNWLMTHPIYGPHIVAWQEKGAISLRAKRLATAMMAVSLALSLIFSLPIRALIFQMIALAGGLIFIWTRPQD